MAIDYRSVRPGGGQEDHFPAGTDRAWWNKSAADAPASISASLSLLEEQERQRGESLIRCMRLYGNVPTHGLTGLTPSPMETVNTGPYRDRLSYNVSQIVTDAITSKMAKNRPRPFYLTSGGDWGERQRAKRLNRYNDGVFHECRAYEIGLMAFRDACVLDAGVVHAFARHGRINMERVPSSELKVDEIEGFYGCPRQMHRLKLIDRAVAAKAWPDRAALIKGARGAFVNEAMASKPHISDMLLVRESWHLPSSPDAKDGAHIVTLDEGPLTPLEDWPHDFFPFAVMRWNTKLVGMWGQSLVEQLIPIQLAINKHLYFMQRSYHMQGGYKILLPMGAKTPTEHFNNDIGTIIKYQGNTPPSYVTPPAVSMDSYQFLDWLVGKAFETARLSQLSAVGQKPAGLNSGEAQRVYHDIESDGFQTVGKAYESFYVELADITRALTLDLMREHKLKEYEVSRAGSRSVEMVRVSEKDLDEDEHDFVLQCFPVSSLPQEPAGRMATVQEWVQAGWIDAKTGKRLQNFPDIDAEENLANAAEDFIEQQLEKIIEEDDYSYTPEPYDNPPQFFEMAHQYYLAGKRDNLDEEKLEKLRTLMDACRSLMQAAAPPTGGPPGAAQPQAVPQAPPTSPLLPNAPGAQA